MFSTHSYSVVLLLLGVVHFFRWNQWRILVQQRPVLAIEAAELQRQQLSSLQNRDDVALEIVSTEPPPRAPPENFIQGHDTAVDFDDSTKSMDFSFKTVEYGADEPKK